MNHYTVTYETKLEPSEIYTWVGPGADLGDVLYNFYRGESDFSYETPIIIDIEEH